MPKSLDFQVDQARISREKIHLFMNSMMAVDCYMEKIIDQGQSSEENPKLTERLYREVESLFEVFKVHFPDLYLLRHLYIIGRQIVHHGDDSLQEELHLQRGVEDTRVVRQNQLDIIAENELQIKVRNLKEDDKLIFNRISDLGVCFIKLFSSGYSIPPMDSSSLPNETSEEKPPVLALQTQMITEIADFSEEDSQLTGTFHFKDNENSALITHCGLFQLFSCLVTILIKMTAKKKPRAEVDANRPQDPEEVEYVMLAFKDSDREGQPFFSYVISSEYKPLQLQGILLRENKECPELSILNVQLAVADKIQNRTSIQNVMIDQKKFRNVIVSKGRFEAAQNYLRCRNFDSQADLLVYLGSQRFIYYRFDSSEKTWSENLKTGHSLVEYSSSGLNMMRDLLDFQVIQTSSGGTEVCMLSAANQFYYVSINSLIYDSMTRNYKLRELKCLEFWSESVVYSSLMMANTTIGKKIIMMGIAVDDSVKPDNISLQFTFKSYILNDREEFQEADGSIPRITMPKETGHLQDELSTISNGTQSDLKSTCIEHIKKIAVQTDVSTIISNKSASKTVAALTFAGKEAFICRTTITDDGSTELSKLRLNDMIHVDKKLMQDDSYILSMTTSHPDLQDQSLKKMILTTSNHNLIELKVRLAELATKPRNCDF